MMNTLIPLGRIDEMFDAFFAPTTRTNGDSELRVPRADILEGEQDFMVRLDLPGIDREDLDISLENETLTIKAERKVEAPEGYRAHRRELPGRMTFKRSFNLGNHVDAEGIKAELKDGVLAIRLPKSRQAMPRRIEVK
jgi:HSP20 family protein